MSDSLFKFKIASLEPVCWKLFLSKITVKLFNLRRYVRNKLLKYGIKVDQIYLDTFTEKKYFFSYRRSQKLKEVDYGRNISVITLKA